ncbi:unnamed protein product [Acanthoscelides obtectus]|nr:unnamed protein product [Acanthoscelides obtectus]CAK1674785.1 hypothetical protein AOBTE_LOCUS29740 [Acanthoscelides obtectus]
MGAIPSFMDTAINEQEIMHQIKLCQPKIIVTYDDQEVMDTLRRVLESIELDIDIIVLEKEKAFLEFRDEESSFQPVFVEDLQKTAAIFFSSGSTGYPKAICLSHVSIFDEILLKGIPRSEDEPMVILGFDNYYWLVETWKLVGIVKDHGIRIISPTFDIKEIWTMIDKYKVVDLDTGERLGPNKAGELRVKSRNILNCYYRVPNSDHLDSDGWFKTGDVVKYDEDLCFYFEGRIKDIIVYQGWHVAPGILETKLKSHPAVKRAAVVGKPHPADGEHPLALVELSDGRTDVDLMEIKEFVDEDMNDIYKLRGGIVAVKKLPVTITGKVKKGLLRKMMEGRMVVSATEEVSDSFSQRA